MRITGIVWLEQIVEKLWHKHQVQQDEVEEVLANSPHFRFVEKGLRKGEDVYAALGQNDGGRFLIVYFIGNNDGQALILSARDMSQPERRRYESR